MHRRPKAAAATPDEAGDGQVRRLPFEEPAALLGSVGSHRAHVGAETKNEEEAEKRWNSQYKQMWRIPASWWACWLVMYANGRICHAMIERMTHKDHNAVKQVVFFLLQILPRDILPKAMLDKHVASRVFTHRANQLGRLDRLLEHMSKDGSTVDWRSLGPFIVHFRDGFACTIDHISGDVAQVPPDAVFSQAAEVQDAHLDCLASVLGRVAPLPLCKYFDNKMGPHRHALDADGKVLGELAAKFSKQRDMQAQQVEKGHVHEDPGVLPDVHAEKRLAALQAARVMLKNRQKGHIVKLASEGSDGAQDGATQVLASSSAASSSPAAPPAPQVPECTSRGPSGDVA